MTGTIRETLFDALSYSNVIVLNCIEGLRLPHSFYNSLRQLLFMIGFYVGGYFKDIFNPDGTRRRIIDLLYHPETYGGEWAASVNMLNRKRPSIYEKVFDLLNRGWFRENDLRLVFGL